MKEVTLTEEQARAVASRGKVIVSASAGSGKTFVMIERLVSLILGGADVKKMLAVTFTNKAAAQMREKLRKALIEKIGGSGDEERERLKEQLAALPLADISTIHAFCARLVRTYFYLADVDPAFRIVSFEEQDGAILASRALDEVFDGMYAEKDERFLHLLDCYFRSKKDALLRKIVLSLYKKVRGKSDYRALLENAGKDEFEETAEYVAEDIRARARFLCEKTEEQAVFYAENSARALEVCKQIHIAAEAVSKGDLFTLAAQKINPIPNVPPSTKATGELLKNLTCTKKLSAGVKELYKELATFGSREEEYARYLDAQGTVRALCFLLLRFDGVYSRLKREEGVLDYDDLEHCALAVLGNEEARAAVRGKYEYVFVDEYQDVNPAQERILSLVAGEEVFLVGDAKQSIYGFRGSRSDYFVQKCAEYGALTLTENFRSSANVLEAVNRVFSYAMTEESAGIPYSAAPMRGGNRYGGHDGGVRFYTVPAEEKEKKERGVYSVLEGGGEKDDPQARYLCDLIREEVGSEWFDVDAKLVKRLTYGDIAVLVRSDTGSTERIVSALSENNIPVVTTSRVNICTYWEVRLLIDWLSFLDNGEQDIPYAGALLSRIGGLTEADLARVRLRFPHTGTFRAACREYMAKVRDDVSEKLHTFHQKADNYRALMQVRTAAEMLGTLLSDGLETEIMARQDGPARMRRVRRLMEEAQGSPSAFLRRLRALSFDVEYAASGGDDAVKVLTMHAAKGLEYPVVFLVNLDAHFHGNGRDEVLCTDRFLFAPKSYDVGKRIVHGNMLRRASLLYEDKETVKGELNVLYVAMTRAKYRLNMLFRRKESALAPQYAERFSDFVDFSVCGDYFAEAQESLPPARPRPALVYRADAELVDEILQVYRREYPFAESALLPVKSSATGLMRSEREIAPVPKESGKGGTVEEGLAYHAFLQFYRFGAPWREELARMEREGLLPADRIALLDGEKLAAITSLPSLAALKNTRVWREQTFLVSLAAREVLPVSAEDEIVLQGAIDLLAEDGEGYLILDYKYSSHDAERLKKDYAPQIALYRKAVARVKGVDERTIRARLINIMGLFEVEM